ncbi:hypothetical protein [Streptomyces flaveolus]|nr:hypothetical protein [Streptomyces flaveolus]
MPGALTDIGAGADGTVRGVNSAGNIYRYTATRTAAIGSRSAAG